MRDGRPGHWRAWQPARGPWAWCLVILAASTACQQGQRGLPGTTTPPVVDAPPEASTWIELQPGLRISPGRQEVMLDTEICLSDGWLEQVVCAPGTREHESIMVTSVPASAFHAGLLAVGFQSGRPGSWRWDQSTVFRVPPEGSAVQILVAPAGKDTWVPVRDWIMNERGRSPQGHWIFGGSTMRDDESLPPGVSRYEADLSGSIVGLVTFGDETLGFSEVIPHELAVVPEAWRVRSEAIPPVGSAVRVLVRPFHDPG